MIVGGLKGLCGSLAIHLAAHSAKQVIAVSRTGIWDEKSHAIVKNCEVLGCKVEEAKVDVTSKEAVEGVFERSIMPVGGVVQGAIVLRVSINHLIPP